MIASLAMYDRPEVADANIRFWSLIAVGLEEIGIPSPKQLTQGEDAFWPTWNAPDLVLSQTCGLPYRARLHEKVTLIGTPCYGVEGCPSGFYRSYIVARKQDTDLPLPEILERCLAFNDPLSQSGWAALQSLYHRYSVAPDRCLESGSHQNSAFAVLSERADYAAIDAVTWAFLERHVPWVSGLVVVARTEPTPGLPLIGGMGADRKAIFAVVKHAIEMLSDQDRAALMLRSLVWIPPEDYLRLPIPPAITSGMPVT